MVLKEQNLKKFMNSVIRQNIIEYKSFGLFYVVGIDANNYKVNLQSSNDKIQLNGVKFCTPYAGNGYGFFQLPNINDLCIVGFVGKNKAEPIVLGFLYDTDVSQDTDYVIPIKQNELLYINKLNGAMIFINENNKIVMQSGKDSSTFTLGEDGSLSLKNKDGYGIAVNASGKVTIHGTDIDFKQTPMS